MLTCVLRCCCCRVSTSLLHRMVPTRRAFTVGLALEYHASSKSTSFFLKKKGLKKIKIGKKGRQLGII
jgi:hypothetical protein